MDIPSQDFSRVNRTGEQAERFYSRLAPWYDLLAASERKFMLCGLDLLDLQPDDIILEIGFGTGFAQERIGRALDTGLSIGLDISAGMARLAQRRIQRSSLEGRVALLRSSSLPLPFSSQSVNKVFSSFTLELFDTPEIPVLLQECRRIIKPGGLLVVVALSRDIPLGLAGRMYESFHDRFPRLADCRPIPVIHLLEESGYSLQSHTAGRMWGLPVIVVSARS